MMFFFINLHLIFCITWFCSVNSSSAELPLSGSSRPDVLIKDLTQHTLHIDLPNDVKWRSTAFNHSIFLCAFNKHMLQFYKVSKFNALKVEKIFNDQINIKQEEIVDVELYLSEDADDQRMSIALLTKNSPMIPVREGRLRIYHIKESKDLIESITQVIRGAPVDLEHVCAQRSCAMVVMLDGYRNTDAILTKLPGNSETLVQIGMPNAVTLSSIRVKGYAHLMIANQTSVLVYKANQLMTALALYSRIPARGLTSAVFFRCGHDLQIALASLNRQTILSLRQNTEWVKIIETSIPAAGEWIAVYPLSYKTYLLTLTTQQSNRPLLLFTYSAEQSKLTEVNTDAFKLNDLIVLHRSMTSFIERNHLIHTVFYDAKNAKTVLLSIKYDLLPKVNPSAVIREAAKQKITQLKIRYEAQRQIYERAMQVMAEGALRSAPVHQFKKSKLFAHIYVKGKLSAPFKQKVRVGIERSNVDVAYVKDVLSDVRRKLDHVRQKINYANELLRDAVFKNTSNIITGRKIITGSVTIPNLISPRYTSIDWFGKEHAADVVKSLYLFGDGKPLTSKLVFQGGLNVKGVATNSLNGLKIPQDIVLTDVNTEISGAITFTQPVYVKQNVITNGNLGGIVNINNAMMTGRAYNMPAQHKAFKHLYVKDSVNTNRINGHSPRSLEEDLLNTNKHQVITSPVYINGNVRFSHISTGRLNGVNIGDPLKKYMFIDRPSVVKGHKIFHNVRLAKGLEVRTILNDLRIPQDLMLKDAEQVVQGEKIFRGRLDANSFIMESGINSLKYPQDFVTLTRPSEVHSPLIFNQGASFRGNIITNAPVDGLMIDKFMKWKANQSHIIHNVVFHKPVTVRGDIHVTGFVNGENVQALANDIIRTDDLRTPLKITGKKIIKNLQLKHASVSPVVNGMNLDIDLVHLSGKQRIGGTKVISGDWRVGSISSRGSIIDQINMKVKMNSRVTLHTPQVIKKPLSFDSLISAKVTTEHLLNGTKFPDNYLLTNKPQTIEGVVYFNDIIIRSKIQRPEEVISANHIAGLGSYLNQTFKLNGEYNIPVAVSLDGVDATSARAKLVQGIDFAKFTKRLMRASRPQVITGKNVFKRLYSSEPIVTPSVNGYSLYSANKHAISLSKPMKISVPLSFQDQIEINGPLITSTINNQRAEILDRVAQRDDTVISAPSIFKAPVTSHADISAEKVNGLILKRDLLTIHDPQVIENNLHLNGTLSVRSSIDEVDKVNGFNLRKLDASIAKSNSPVYLSSPLVINAPLTVKGSVEVSGFLNGVNFEQLVNEAGCLKDQRYIDDLIVNGDVVFTKGVHIDQYNQHDVKEILNEIVFNDGATYHMRNKIFKQLNVEGNVRCSKVHIDGVINGVSLREKLSGAIPLYGGDKDIGGRLIVRAPCVIRHSLLVNHTVNGVKVPEDILRRCGDKACPNQTLHNVKISSLKTANIHLSGRHASHEKWKHFQTPVLNEEQLQKQILTGRPVSKIVVSGSANIRHLNNRPFTERLISTKDGTMLLSPIFEDIYTDAVMVNRGDLNCTTRQQSLLCRLAAMNRRGCFSTEKGIAKFNKIILEQGAVANYVNDVNLSDYRRNLTRRLDEVHIIQDKSRRLLQSVYPLPNILNDC